MFSQIFIHQYFKRNSQNNKTIVVSEKASLPCTPYELFLNPNEGRNDAPELLHPNPLTSNKLGSLSYFNDYIPEEHRKYISENY